MNITLEIFYIICFCFLLHFLWTTRLLVPHSCFVIPCNNFNVLCIFIYLFAKAAHASNVWAMHNFNCSAFCSFLCLRHFCNFLSQWKNENREENATIPFSARLWTTIKKFKVEPKLNANELWNKKSLQNHRPKSKPIKHKWFIVVNKWLFFFRPIHFSLIWFTFDMNQSNLIRESNLVQYQLHRCTSKCSRIFI